jgi:hypothetical protein
MREKEEKEERNIPLSFSPLFTYKKERKSKDTH